MELLPAKINDRFIAYILDAFPFVAAYLGVHIVMIWTLKRASYTPEFSNRVALGCAAAYLLYQFLGNLAGATVGKRLMGIRVLRADGSPLGVLRSLLRTFGYCLSTPLFNFGFLVAIFHPESRALHDLLSGSVVVEPRPKNPAEAAILFLGAVLTLVAMAGGMVYLAFSQPSPQDLIAVQKAREGLLLMGQIQEKYREKNGTYARQLAEIAEASGDPAVFRGALADIFHGNVVNLDAGNKGYRFSARARDRKRTRVIVEGPPPTLRDK